MLKIRISLLAMGCMALALALGSCSKSDDVTRIVDAEFAHPELVSYGELSGAELERAVNSLDEARPHFVECPGDQKSNGNRTTNANSHARDCIQFCHCRHTGLGKGQSQEPAQNDLECRTMVAPPDRLVNEHGFGRRENAPGSGWGDQLECGTVTSTGTGSGTGTGTTSGTGTGTGTGTETGTGTGASTDTGTGAGTGTSSDGGGEGPPF